MSEEPSPSEFLISKMEGMDDVVQVLIITRTVEGEISYDTCGQIAADTLGMLEFVRIAATEHLRRALYGEDVDSSYPTLSPGKEKTEHEIQLGVGMDDNALIAAARLGNEDAFTTIYNRHLPYVKAVGRAILRKNDLDDLCQETFLLAFTRLDSFKGDSNFRTWITRIAMNQCLMALRRARQISNGESHLVQIDTEAANDDVLDQCMFIIEDKELTAVPARVDLAKLMKVVKPAHRRILRMAYLEDIPDQEIADALGITLSSVKSTIYHAKRRIREACKKR